MSSATNAPVEAAPPAPKKRPSLTSFGPVIAGVVVAAMLITAVFLLRKQTQFGTGSVVIGGDLEVRVKVAATFSTREKGLSGHDPLADGQGMYFIFDEPGEFSFWMKDMLFPIDIIWIEDGQIADMTVNVPVPVKGQPLPTYSPRVPVSRVLEVPAGFAREHGLRLGLPVEERLED